jgi:hypothetical protein
MPRGFSDLRVHVYTALTSYRSTMACLK